MSNSDRVPSRLPRSNVHTQKILEHFVVLTAAPFPVTDTYRQLPPLTRYAAMCSRVTIKGAVTAPASRSVGGGPHWE